MNNNTSYANCYLENRSDIDDQASAILELISGLKNVNTSDITVLDIGSGPGRLAIPISQKVHRLACIESDLSAVNHLRTKAENNNAEIEIYPSKIQDLCSEETGCFDLVILSHIIHWFDFTYLLELSEKFIADNGYILLSYFDLDKLKNMLFYKISGKEILRIQEKHTLSTQRIRHLLDQADLKIIQQIDIPLNVNYGNGKLENIINSAGTLAWHKAREKSSIKEYLELKSSAITRLGTTDCLIDTEYRTMILAQKKNLTK